MKVPSSLLLCNAIRCDLWTCLKVRQRREVATKGRATCKVNLRGDIPKTRTVLDVLSLPLSLFLPLRTNLRQFIMWLYPIAKATGLEWSPACSISLVLTTSPPRLPSPTFYGKQNLCFLLALLTRLINLFFLYFSRSFHFFSFICVLLIFLLPLALISSSLCRRLFI